MSAMNTQNHYRRDVPLPPQCNHSPVISVLICLLLHLGRERNGTHNAIPELLIEDRLVCISIVLHNLIQPVNQWLFGWHFHRTTPVRKAAQLVSKLGLVDPQDRGQLFDVLGGGLGLAVENGSYSNLIAADMLGDLLKGEFLGGFSVEEGLGGAGEIRVLRSLIVSWGWADTVSKDCLHPELPETY